MCVEFIHVSYFLHFLGLVVIYRNLDFTHAFNIIVDHLGGPIRMLCDSVPSVWEADAFFPKHTVHGFYVTAVFYAQQELGK